MPFQPSRAALASSAARTLAHAIPSVCQARLFALTPLALCLAQAAMAQQADAPAAEAAASAHSATAPQLQEVRINASTEKDMGCRPWRGSARSTLGAGGLTI